MRATHALAAVTAALMFVGLAGGARADQNDPRLDTLFAALHATRDADEGARLGREIAAIWRQSDNALVSTLTAQASRLLSMGQHRAALEKYMRVVKLAPGYAEGWNQRAHIHYLMGNYREAIDDIRRAVELEPRHFLALAGLGQIYLQLGEEPAALQALERALEINPHLPGVRSAVLDLKVKFDSKKI